MRLRNSDGVLKANLIPVGFAVVESTDFQGPLSWGRIALNGSQSRYNAIVNVIDESSLRGSGARVVAILNKKSGKPIEIRPSEFNADLGWGPGNRAQAQQGPNRPAGFPCQEWLMLPLKYNGETVYRFHNLSSLKALDVDGLEITKPGVKTSQWTAPPGPPKANQIFRLQPAGTDTYRIVCVESGMLLDFNYFAINDVSGGCVLSQWGPAAAPADHQLWWFADR